MKTFTKVTLLTVGLASAALPFLIAADNTAPTPAPAVAGRHPRLRAMLMRRMVMVRQVARRLGLSSDQITRLKSLRAQTVSTVKGIRADSTLTIEQKKAKARETLQGARTQMQAVLTPDQQTQLQQMRARRNAAL